MKKQIGINFIAQVVSFIISLGISFFLTPYIVNIIGVEANGFVGLANNFIEYAQLITIALNSMASRYITIRMHQNKLEEANKYFSSLFISNIIISVLLTIVFTFIIVFLTSLINVSENLVADVKILWLLLFSNFIVSVFISVFGISTFTKNRLDLSAICSIKAYAIRAAILIVAYVVFKPHVWYIGLALIAMGVYTLIVHIKYTKKLAPELKVKFEYFDIKKVIELIKSGVWNTITKLSNILSTGLDLLITNLLVNPVAMGVVSLSKTVPTIFASFFTNISTIFAPELTISYAKNENEKMKKDLVFIIKLFGFISSVILVTFVGFGKEFYILWVSTQDANILYTLSVITCLGLVFSLPLEPINNIFTITNKVKNAALFLIGFSIVSIISVFIALYFITDETNKLLAIVGISAIINIIKALTFLPIYGAKCMNCKSSMFYKTIGINLMSVVVLLTIVLVFKNFIVINSWITLFVYLIITAIIQVIINFFIVFNKDERKNFFERIKKFNKSKVNYE